MRLDCAALLCCRPRCCCLPVAPAPAAPGSNWAASAIDVEIADDDAERARGLMFRDAMAADHGMLFIHEREEPQAYWMKNTRIPLDILYFDDTRRLVSQQRDVPPCSLGDPLPAVSERCARALRARAQRRRSRAAASWRTGAELRFGPGVTQPLTARGLATTPNAVAGLRHARRVSTLPDWNALAALRRSTRCRCSAPRC